MNANHKDIVRVIAQLKHSQNVLPNRDLLAEIKDVFKLGFGLQVDGVPLSHYAMEINKILTMKGGDSLNLYAPFSFFSSAQSFPSVGHTVEKPTVISAKLMSGLLRAFARQSLN